MKGKPVIAIVPLGHYIYFRQFEGLYEELCKKADAFRAYFDDSADVFVTEYVNDVDKAFSVVRDVKRRDVDGVFLLLSLIHI